MTITARGVRRRLLMVALSLVLRLGWPTTLADADLDRAPERALPASQEPVRLECGWLGITESAAARMLTALGRPVGCVPRPLEAPAPASRPVVQ